MAPEDSEITAPSASVRFGRFWLNAGAAFVTLIDTVAGADGAPSLAVNVNESAPR